MVWVMLLSSGEAVTRRNDPVFSLGVTPESPWNMLVGANIELTPRFVITAEGGFGNRMQFVIAPGVRF